MSRWLALIEKVEKEIDTSIRHLTKPDKTAPKQPEVGFGRVLSECQVDVEIEHAPTSSSDCKYGIAVGGRPKTWTGKVVSLEEWRKLSAWEMHGPNGRHWNGKTRRWERSYRFLLH